jgi:hypothetical protein
VIDDRLDIAQRIDGLRGENTLSSGVAAAELGPSRILR